MDDIESLDPFALNKDITQCDFPNPLFVPISGSQFMSTKLNFIKDEYKHIFILCLRDDFLLTPDNAEKIRMFHQKDSSNLDQASTLVDMCKAPFFIAYWRSVKMGLVVVDHDVLIPFNHDKHDLRQKELVYLMLETRKSHVLSWLKQYEVEDHFNIFIKQKIISNYYNLTESLTNNLTSLINKMPDFQYWENTRNCHLSSIEKFEKRQFNLKLIAKWNLPLESIEKEMVRILSTIGGTKNASYSDDERTSGIKRKQIKNSFYEAMKEEDLQIRQDAIEELLIGRGLSHKERYNLICNLLISKNYCHYIFSKRVLKANAKDFIKYGPAFRYLIGYAWVCLFMEENNISRSVIKQTDRFVFDLERASTLPVFAFSHEDPHSNPYYSCFLPDNILKSRKAIYGVKQSIPCQQGIVDVQEFKRRLNIFITGNSEKDLFKEADWSHMVISGGCMAAIMPKMNPLMLLFKKDMNGPMLDEELNRFFQEYYSTSDIDIACNHYDILDFIKHVSHLKRVIVQNLNVPEKDVKVNPYKTLNIYINQQVLKEKCESGEIPISYDTIINNKTNNHVKMYFYDMYLVEKMKNRPVLDIDNDESFDIINYCKLDDTALIINDNLTDQTNNNDKTIYYMYDDNNTLFIMFSEILRFVIKSKHFKRKLEIFRTFQKEFFSTVARFHLPCVRSYYNGTTCYLLPSSICAYHTLTNIDFKYFAGKSDPISILNKYRQRGYGTILNKNEIAVFLAYISSSDILKQGYKISSENINDIATELKIDHPFFCSYQYTDSNYYKNIAPNLSLSDHYKNMYPKYSQNLFIKNTIGTDGNVTPIAKWMIDATYDILQK